jgi:hypothetical protein
MFGSGGLTANLPDAFNQALHPLKALELTHLMPLLIPKYAYGAKPK